MGIERRVTAEEEAEISSKVDEIGARVDPVLEVRDGDEAGGIDKGVRAFDDHVARGVDVDAGRVARVRLHEPNDDGDIVGDGLEGDRNGAFGLEKINGTAVVVGEGGGLWVERWVGGD